ARAHFYQSSQQRREIFGAGSNGRLRGGAGWAGRGVRRSRSGDWYFRERSAAIVQGLSSWRERRDATRDRALPLTGQTLRSTARREREAEEQNRRGDDRDS